MAAADHPSMFSTAPLVRLARWPELTSCSGEITDYDESACDAWVGESAVAIRDRVTLFRVATAKNPRSTGQRQRFRHALAPGADWRGVPATSPIRSTRRWL